MPTAVAVLGVGLLLVGCSEDADPRPTESAERSGVEPLWSVQARALGQPLIADGVVVARVVDPDSAGFSVVGWAADSGEELWRHESSSGPVLVEPDGAKIVYLAPRPEGTSLLLADPRTGEEAAVAAPDGWSLLDVRSCEVQEGVCVYGGAAGDYQYRMARLDPVAMTLVEEQQSGYEQYFAEGIVSFTNYDQLHYYGDESQEAWTRSTEEMFGPNTGMEKPWRWLDSRGLLLGTVRTNVLDVEFETSREYVSGGFGPDGQPRWTVGGRPCSDEWTTEPIQVMCAHTGTKTNVSNPIEEGGQTYVDDYPEYSDKRAYVFGLDVRTGEQVWRFPAEGMEREVPETGFRQFALSDDAYVVAWDGDGANLVEVATGESTRLDKDDAFLCPWSVEELIAGPDGEPSTVARDVLRICNYDANPTEALWPGRWIKLAGVHDGDGRYFLAMTNEVVAFRL